MKATSFTSATLLNTSGAVVKTATITSPTVARFDVGGLTAGSFYFININGLTNDLVPTRVDSTTVAMSQYVGTALRRTMIGTNNQNTATYIMKTISLGQGLHAVAKYTNGTNATPTRYSFSTLYMMSLPQKIETRVLGTGALLSSYTAGGEHDLGTWVMGASGHGFNLANGCCHGSLTSKPASYTSISTSNGWCYKCHYGQGGADSGGMIDPTQ